MKITSYNFAKNPESVFVKLILEPNSFDYDFKYLSVTMKEKAFYELIYKMVDIKDDLESWIEKTK